MSGQIFNKWCDRVKAHPHKAALRGGSKVWTFGAVMEAVATAIDSLPPVGRKRWQRRTVVFQFANSADWLVAFLACQQLGAIAVPVDPDVPPAGVESLCAGLRPVCHWDSDGMRTLPQPRLYHLASLVKLTSGSTGQPQPLFFQDTEIIADGEQIIAGMGLRADDIHFGVIPFGHSYGLGNLLMPLILQGAEICLCADALPHALAGAIIRHRPTVFPAVPALLRGLSLASVDGISLASLRLVISAGSPLSPAEATAFRSRFGITVHNFYGSSETGGIAFDASGECTAMGTAIGRLLPGVTARLRSSGRLEVSSKAVFTRRNRMALGGVGRYLLPDMAELEVDGHVRLMGRRTRMLKIGGKRLNPVEVEMRLRACTGVSDAHVAGFRDQRGQMRIAAAVQTQLSARELRSALKPVLPPWKIPHRWLLVDAFPVNARGKVCFKELQRRLLAQ
jgi:acyl-coenzyme A synthetase/AMP-(fatty) acid ligase